MLPSLEKCKPPFLQQHLTMINNLFLPYIPQASCPFQSRTVSTSCSQTLQHFHPSLSGTVSTSYQYLAALPISMSSVTQGPDKDTMTLPRTFCHRDYPLCSQHTLCWSKVASRCISELCDPKAYRLCRWRHPCHHIPTRAMLANCSNCRRNARGYVYLDSPGVH